jgi:hypothetical protein
MHLDKANEWFAFFIFNLKNNRKPTALLLYKSLNPPKIQAFNTACQKQATDLKSDKRTL